MKYLEMRFNTMKKLNVSKTCVNVSVMERSPISEMEVMEIVRMTLNWKGPGRDQIANYRLKKHIATHTYLATSLTKQLRKVKYRTG